MSEYLAGRYQVLDRIGGGQQGSVYRAKDTLLDRHVALKMIEGADVAFGQQDTLKREALLLAKFEHPNLVRVYDVVVDEQGHPVIVMELLDGRPLSTCIERLSEPEVRLFVKQICGAMDEAHRAGLIHRDLKPGNVMYLGRGTPNPRFVILDMGIGKFIDAQAPSSSAGKETYAGGGTPLYMAPEQYNGESGDARTDVYALGSILYEIYTGVAPFQHCGSNLGLMTKAAVSEPPASLFTHSPRLPISPDLDKLVLACLEKEPQRRPQSMAEVAKRYSAAVERLALGESSVFFPDGTIPPPGTAAGGSAEDETRKRPRPHFPGAGAEGGGQANQNPNRVGRAAAVLGTLAALALLGMLLKNMLAPGGEADGQQQASAKISPALPARGQPGEPNRSTAKGARPVRQSTSPAAEPAAGGKLPNGTASPQENTAAASPEPVPTETAVQRLEAYLAAHRGGLRRPAGLESEFIINLPAEELKADFADLVYGAAQETRGLFHVRLNGEEADVLAVSATGEPQRLTLDLSASGPRTASVLDSFSIPDRLAAVVGTYNTDFDDFCLARLLQGQSRLKSIELASSGIGLRVPDVDGERLRELEKLNLSTAGVSGPYILAVAKDAPLVELRVANTDFDSETAAKLPYARLRLLDATNTAINDEGVDTICERGRETLQHLILAGTEISDDVIESLVLLEDLQLLDVQATLMTPLGIEKLRTRMPKTTVLAD